MDKAALTGLLALGLLLTPGVARADITETGTNSPVPIVSGAPRVLVGNGAPNQGILSAEAFGTGTIIISGGAQVTDTRAPADYGVYGALVASAAGSTGTLTLTGAGTTATFHNFLSSAPASLRAPLAIPPASARLVRRPSAH